MTATPGRYSSLLASTNTGAASAGFDTTTSQPGAHQRHVSAAQSDSRWQMQQELLSRQLAEFRRGGGEISPQHGGGGFGTMGNNVSGAAGGGGGDFSNFAEMQRRLRSKLVAMGTGALQPAPGYRDEEEIAANEQFYANERVSAPPTRNAPPPPQQSMSVHFGSGHQHSVGVGSEEPLIGVAGAEVFASRPRAQAESALAASYVGRDGHAPQSEQREMNLRAAGAYQSPSLIGGLVGRFGRAEEGAVGVDHGVGGRSVENAGTSPRAGTGAPKGRSTNQQQQQQQPQPSQPAQQLPSTTPSRGTHNTTTRLYVASPERHATDVARARLQGAGSVGSQEADVSGAEVFAILRMRGIITSHGQTGEHLLPTAQCHRMTLSASELQQLQHLRETIRRQQRNSPRGASSARLAGGSKAADPPSLRSTEAALSVSAGARHAAGGRSATTSPGPAAKAAAPKRTITPVATRRATPTATRSGTPPAEEPSPPKPRFRR
jgi:hypothetical protein